MYDQKILGFFCKLLLLLLFIHVAEAVLEFRKTSRGLVQGRLTSGNAGTTGYVFRGIPYAEPPVGDLRFGRPMPRRRWIGVWNATSPAPACYYNSSKSHWTKVVPKSEDCLYVDVYVSDRCLRRGGCAVMHYIYGGRFIFGTTQRYDEQIIVENFCAKGRDVVVVIPSYRVGVFGELNLNYKFNDISLTNNGLHDILESLRWTQREVSNFGGDPTRVTLMGHSSGSRTVQQLSVAPKARGYFKQVVSMSGSGSVEPLVKDRNENASRLVAREMNCVSVDESANPTFWESRTDVSRVLACLRAIAPSALNAAGMAAEFNGISLGGLSLEVTLDGILTDTFSNLLKANPPAYPALTGTSSKEYLDSLVVLDASSGRPDPLKLSLYCREVVNRAGYESLAEATVACVEEYKNLTRTPFIFDDEVFFVPHFLYADSVRRAGASAFLYEFQYQFIGDAYREPNNGKYGTDPALTPRHSQDLLYLLGQNRGKFAERDRWMQTLMSEVFTNFINTGNPNGGRVTDFERFEPSRASYYVIDFVDRNSTEPSLVGSVNGYHREATAFWLGKMSRIGGRIIALENTSEANRKTDLPSVYLSDDLQKAKERLDPWLWENGEGPLWQTLFYVMLGVAVILIIGWVITCVIQHRNKIGYSAI